MSWLDRIVFGTQMRLNSAFKAVHMARIDRGIRRVQTQMARENALHKQMVSELIAELNGLAARRVAVMNKQEAVHG
jgi:hypothetical protein